MAYDLLYLLHYPIYLPVPHAHTIYRYTRSAPLPICPFPSSAYPMPRVCLEDLAHITIITYHTPHAYLAIISRAEVDCLARTSPSDKMPPPPRRKLTRATDPTVASLHARANPARPATAPTAPTAGRKSGSARPTAEEEELKHLLRSHNSKFAAAKTLYEPRTQSVAAMRDWERRSGRTYATLSVEERVQANQEINAGGSTATPVMA